MRWTGNCGMKTSRRDVEMKKLLLFILLFVVALCFSLCPIGEHHNNDSRRGWTSNSLVFIQTRTLVISLNIPRFCAKNLLKAMDAATCSLDIIVALISLWSAKWCQRVSTPIENVTSLNADGYKICPILRLLLITFGRINVGMF